MSVQTIDAKMLQKMFLAGAKGLEAKKEYINELNVFPVPDGDTGTNMTMTIMAAAKDVANLQNPTLTELGKAISSGSLRGARGNSEYPLIAAKIFFISCTDKSKYSFSSIFLHLSFSDYSILYPTFRTVFILFRSLPIFCRNVFICISTVLDSP